MPLVQQYLDQIRVQMPAEDQWSEPIEYMFGGLHFRSQIALTDLTDTDGEPISGDTYHDMSLTDPLWIVQTLGLMVAHHPLYIAISEGRDGAARQSYESLHNPQGPYGIHLTGSGIEYSGDKAVLGIDPIVLDRENGLTRYRHAIPVERLSSKVGGQVLLDERSSWFSRQGGRKLKHPIKLYESTSDGLKYLCVDFVRTDGEVHVSAGAPPSSNLAWYIRLMRKH